MENVTFNDIRKMFDALLNKGYSAEEVLSFPTFVGTPKDFIGVTVAETHNKVLIATKSILSVVDNDGRCFIETGCDKNGESLGLWTEEKFDEIQQLLGYCKVDKNTEKDIFDVILSKFKC